jgi:serine/threonine-protein kinase
VVVDLFNTTAAQGDSLIGRTLDGRYEVTGRLGEGAWASCTAGARSTSAGTSRSRCCHKDAAAIPEWRLRFEREAQALSVLAHPNVVPVTDSGFDKRRPVPGDGAPAGQDAGGSPEDRPLPLWRALDIARQTLRGLAFAHGKGIVHRDLKPANVFLQQLPDQDDHVRLAGLRHGEVPREVASRDTPPRR